MELVYFCLFHLTLNYSNMLIVRTYFKRMRQKRSSVNNASSLKQHQLFKELIAMEGSLQICEAMRL